MKRHRTFCRTLALLLVLSVFGALALTAGPVPAAAAGADGGVDSGIPAGVIVVSDLDGISHKLIATPGITDGINQGLVGDDPKMIINGVEYKKGFCTHPVSAAEPSEITVDISRYSSDYPVFHVITGKDYTTEGGGNGHTYRFEVLADGEVKYASEVLDLGDVAEIYVDVDGAQELSILCYSAGPFAWLTVDFADPYLCRRDTAPTAAPTEVPTEPPTAEPTTNAEASAAPTTNANAEGSARPMPDPIAEATAGPSGSAHTHSFDGVYHHNSIEHWLECSCGERTAVANHVVTEWKTVTKPTKNTVGVRKGTCAVCGAEILDTVTYEDYDGDETARDPMSWMLIVGLGLAGLAGIGCIISFAIVIAKSRKRRRRD